MLSARILVSLVLVLSVSCQYEQHLGYILGRLTVASYCKPHLIESWTCQPCKKYPNMKYVNVIKNSTNDTLGYIGVSDELNATVLVFRGTLPWDLKNWISDINFLKKKYPFCDNGCEVHRGFMEDYQDIQDAVLAHVKNYTALFKKPYVFVTGHSLGGALSTHAVAHLLAKGIKVHKYYSLGSPRVGDAKFHEWFNRVNNKTFVARITHHKDWVPHLPFEEWGFQHLNNEVFYNEGFTQYKVCNDSGEDNTCANQYPEYEDLNNGDHITYFRYDYALQVLQCQ